MTPEFTTGTDALVRLNMRTGRYFLQEYLDWLGALFTLEREYPGWFVAHMLTFTVGSSNGRQRISSAAGVTADHGRKVPQETQKRGLDER
jgi:hypothetical protein